MLLTVAAEFNSSPYVKLLEIDEEYGGFRILYIDTSSDEELSQLKEVLDEGLTFADFQVTKTKTGRDTEAFELRHFCTNVAPGEPDLTLHGFVVEDEPSFMGFVRNLIRESGSVILPLRDVPENDIPYWMVAAVNTFQFTDDMGIKVSHLIPGSEEGVWRWSSSVILQNSHEDKFGDVTSLRFLCLTEFDLGEYDQYVIEHEPVRVVQENGATLTYRCISVKEDLPIYTSKSNVMVTPTIISRIKFVADSYKLALYSLTEGLFKDKVIETSNNYYRNDAVVTGRYLKIKNKTPITKKTSIEMQKFLLDSLSGKKSANDELEFLREYPHYQVYASIVKSQIDKFFNADVTYQKKMRAYRALKNMETYLYLLLQECRYTVMFDNDAMLFNLWTSNSSFNSDIPNYKVTIAGGGGTWRPSIYF